MTREEAIKILEEVRLIDDSLYQYNLKYLEALNMAIRALKDMSLFRQVQEIGDCNICENKNCGYKPEPGQIVRYNCPFYKAESEEEE